MKLGVVGLPNVGKSTLFNAITKAGAQAANYPFCTIEPNTGMVMVPDSRLDDLAAMYHPKKVTPTTIEFVDIAGLVKGASRGEGLGNKFLSHIREVDAIVHVVRCFEDENIIHVDGSIDPARDIETINLELIFADMETVSRRRDKAVKNMRGGDKKSAVEAALAEKLYAHLESGKPARTYPYDEEKREIVDSWFLLTTKPVIYAANIAEDDLGKDIDQIPGLDRVQAIAQAEHAEMLVISAAIEEEICPDGAGGKGGYSLRSWALAESWSGPADYCLLPSSGADFLPHRRRGRVPRLDHPGGHQGTRRRPGRFIPTLKRALSVRRLCPLRRSRSCGSMAACREKGLVRSEGKDYVMKDGDVTLFRFNV